MRAPTRSRRPTASSCARRTPTSIRTIRRPRSASSRSRRPTRSCPIPRSASSTTCWARPACAARRRAAASIRACSTRTASTSPTSSAASSAAAGGGRAARAQPERGHDLEAGVTISFRDSLNGARVSIAVEALAPCTDLPRLRRRGRHAARSRARTATAAACAHQAQGFFSLSQPCLRCGGTGHVIEHPCLNCGGRGSTQRLRRYQVPIPAGHQGRRAHPPARQGRGGRARRARRRPLRAGHGRALAGLHAARRRPASSTCPCSSARLPRAPRSTCRHPTASACA